jgi:hypothetical protein
MNTTELGRRKVGSPFALRPWFLKRRTSPVAV